MTLYYFFGAAFLGLIIGSFLNMLIPRLHTGEKGIFFGRSHCTKCKKQLKGTELIPLVSYLFLKGKCRHCKKHISLWYPATEIVTASTFAILTLIAPDLQTWLWQTGMFIVLLFILFYDLRYKEIHDGVMIPGIVFAALASFFIGDFTDSLIGGVIGFTFFALQYLISRGRAIGAGDMRIGAFMGLMLGWHLTLVALVVGYIFGSIVSLFLLATKKANGKTALPLGPFLVFGTVIAFFYGNQILQWYLMI
jgi:prepilin signal peptidase PulO-like enzyme (type II secretory pathway)